jgi:hypothetical protein
MKGDAKPLSKFLMAQKTGLLSQFINVITIGERNNAKDFMTILFKLLRRTVLATSLGV